MLLYITIVISLKNVIQKGYDLATQASLRCFYVDSNSVEDLAEIKVRKNIRKKEKIHCHLRYRYFVTVNLIVTMNVDIL